MSWPPLASPQRGFTHQDFAESTPGGSLGRKLSKVVEVMRPLDQCCVAEESRSLREIYIRSHRPPRRSGAIILTGKNERLTGIFRTAIWPGCSNENEIGH